VFQGIVSDVNLVENPLGPRAMHFWVIEGPYGREGGGGVPIYSLNGERRQKRR